MDAILKYLNQHSTTLPKEIQASVELIARSGGTPLVVAENQRALGVIHLKDIVKGGMRERFKHLRAMGIKTVMITGDNPLTAAAIAREAGVDDFLAQATPKDKMDLIKREQGDGKPIAMTEGNKDAPALRSRRWRGNFGTQLPQPATWRISIPIPKLIEIVGDQQQRHDARLTDTFSIATTWPLHHPGHVCRDLPVLNALNHASRHQSRQSPAVIFNALIISG